MDVQTPFIGKPRPACLLALCPLIARLKCIALKMRRESIKCCVSVMKTTFCSKLIFDSLLINSKKSTFLSKLIVIRTR